MNMKNLAMWAAIVFLTIGLYNMFKNPQANAGKNNSIIFSDFLSEVDNGRVVKVEIQGNNINGILADGNSFFSKRRNNYILSDNFFDQSHEIIFRSLTKIIQRLGKKYYPVRGKSITELIIGINTKSFSKVTLGGCFIERVNETILISKEN